MLQCCQDHNLAACEAHLGGFLSSGQFRFGYFTAHYEATLAFYRDGLDFPVVEAWDRGPDDRGTLFAAANGIVEVLALPASGDCSHLWDSRPPQGVFMAIEVNQVDDSYRRVLQKQLPIQQELRDQTWGHRSFCVQDPNGLTLYFFSEKKED